MSENTFEDLHLSEATLRGIADAGYEKPLPVQSEVVPLAMQDNDIVACAQTGTGKTAAFLIPLIEMLQEMGPSTRYRPHALVLSPTRELAIQVGEHFKILAGHTKLKGAVIYGGVGTGEQERSFEEGADLLIATPGRLLDHLGRGGLKMTEITCFVIDESDRLFDAGFLPSVRKIVDYLPENRQTMLFSATMPKEMESFARQVLRSPKRIQLGAVETRETITEAFWPVPTSQKTDLLKALLAHEEKVEQALVFVRTRAKAKELIQVLADKIEGESGELHSELSQAQREETLSAFKQGKLKLLVATDVASRGLDIQGISHVFNYDVPNTPDDYIHRVGRTGRVDRTGIAHTLVSPSELALSASIEDSLRRRIKTRRLMGFDYKVEEENSEEMIQPFKRGKARPFSERKTVKGKKENPFTKSGRLKKKFRDENEEKEDKPVKRKKEERRLLGKKLPHQRRRRGK